MREIRKISKKSGLRTFLLNGTRKVLRSGGTLLIDAADRLPAPVQFSLSPDDRHILERNQAFKDKHKGQRCFVIGNGPSLKTQDISPLANEITFVMSGFWKHPVVEKWQPTYYCFADTLFFDGSEPMREFFRSLKSRIRDSKFFVPLHAMKAIEEYVLLPLEQTHYVAFCGKLDDIKTDINLAGCVPSPGSVSSLCIMAAMYMGCSPIYLMGLDHDWLSHRGPSLLFYEGYAGLENHPKFRPNLGDWSYKYQMECQLKLWLRYEVLLALAARKGIRIFNATKGGFLDVFERVDYQKVIGK